MKHIYESLLDNSNGKYKYKNCTDFRDNSFKVLHISVSLDKVKIECANTLTINTYGCSEGYYNESNLFFICITAFICNFVRKLGIYKKFSNVVELSGKYDILTVQETRK